MNKIYLTLVLVCLLMNKSYAQEVTDTVETTLPCYNTEEIFKSLKEHYKEFPILTGKAGDFANSIVSVWMNPTENSWTIIATKKDISCVIGMGTDMNLVPHKKGPKI